MQLLQFILVLVLCFFFLRRIMPNGFGFLRLLINENKTKSRKGRKWERDRENTKKKKVTWCQIEFFPGAGFIVNWTYFQCGSMPNPLMDFLTWVLLSMCLIIFVPCLPHHENATLGWPAVISQRWKKNGQNKRAQIPLAFKVSWAGVHVSWLHTYMYWCFALRAHGSRIRTLWPIIRCFFFYFFLLVPFRRCSYHSYHSLILL